MTVLYELFNLDQWMDIMHQAQWKFPTYIMMKSNIYSTIHQLLTCPHWASTMARSRHGTLATNHRMRASVMLCHSLPTAARSSVSFLGNGFIQLRHLDIYNHMFSMILIPGLFGGHRRTSINWQETPGLPWLHIQYIPRNMHTVLLGFALFWLCNRS